MNLRFCIENQYKCFHWKSIFFRIIFLLEINTKFPIKFTLHFELLFDDRKASFCVENQYNWKSVCFRPPHFSVFIVKIAKIFTVKITKIYVVKMSDWNYNFYWFCYYFWNCDFLIWIPIQNSIANKRFLPASISPENQYIFIFRFGLLF